MKKSALILILISLLFPGRAFASAEEYHKYFEININETYPSLLELRQKYAKNTHFDRGYDYGWNIGKIFSSEFRKIIKQYGLSEKRLKNGTEDQLLESITMMPKSTYPYIGPVLHTIPGMSEKILNLPGIKETKNQFPTRIAPQVAGINELEFVSPALYFVLMPESWPGNIKTLERPVKNRVPPKAPYNPKFFAALEQTVRFKNYQPNAPKPGLTRDKLRTISPTENSLITAKDVAAVNNTFSGIQKLATDFPTVVALTDAGSLLDAWESDQKQTLPLPILKDLANPCRRLIQKFRILGRERELSAIAAKEGFTLEEWGFTCDKTIKAYRAATMSLNTATALDAFRHGALNSEIDKMGSETATRSYAIMQTIIEMYNAPLSDITAIQKNRKNLDDSFHNLGYLLIVNPIKGLD